MPVLRRAFRALGLLTVVPLLVTFAPPAAAYCTQTQWMDLCGNQGGYLPCQCDYMDDVNDSIDLSPERPSRPNNRPDNSLPGSNRPGRGGGGGRR